jgi:hypothetical protein
MSVMSESHVRESLRNGRFRRYRRTGGPGEEALQGQAALPSGDGPLLRASRKRGKVDSLPAACGAFPPGEYFIIHVHS